MRAVIFREAKLAVTSGGIWRSGCTGPALVQALVSQAGVERGASARSDLWM